MGLLRTLFWVGLFVASTFAFTVLFEHGTSDFSANSQKEWDKLMLQYHALVDKDGGKAAAKPH